MCPKKRDFFIFGELSHLELQLWGCGVLLSHMAWLHTCQHVKHSYCIPSGAVWHPVPANHHPRGTGTGICCYSVPAGNTLLGRSSKNSSLSSSSRYSHPNDVPSWNHLHKKEFNWLHFGHRKCWHTWSRCNNGGSTNVNVFFNILLNSL